MLEFLLSCVIKLCLFLSFSPLQAEVGFLNITNASLCFLSSGIAPLHAMVSFVFFSPHPMLGKNTRCLREGDFGFRALGAHDFCSNRTRSYSLTSKIRKDTRGSLFSGTVSSTKARQKEHRFEKKRFSPDLLTLQTCRNTAIYTMLSFCDGKRILALSLVPFNSQKLPDLVRKYFGQELSHFYRQG